MGGAWARSSWPAIPRPASRNSTRTATASSKLRGDHRHDDGLELLPGLAVDHACRVELRERLVAVLAGLRSREVARPRLLEDRHDLGDLGSRDVAVAVEARKRLAVLG